MNTRQTGLLQQHFTTASQALYTNSLNYNHLPQNDTIGIQGN